MVATVVPLDDVTLPRVAQLIGKTNQFNLTGRRRSASEVEALVGDPRRLTLCVRLRDRFADHGLVGVLIAEVQDDATLLVDTWLMSCRVIGRTLEHEMLVLLADRAAALGCMRLRGTYVRTAKNALVADLYPRLGFRPDPGAESAEPAGRSAWVLPVDEVPATGGFITVDTREETS